MNITAHNVHTMGVVNHCTHFSELLKMNVTCTTPTKHLCSDILFLVRKVVVLVGGKCGDISRQLRNVMFHGVVCVAVFSCDPSTLLLLFLLGRCFSRVVPLLNISLIIRIVINQIEKLYHCTCTRFCILLYKKGNFDIIILFKIESSNHREANHKIISSYNMLFLRINCRFSQIIQLNCKFWSFNKLIVSLFKIHHVFFPSQVQSILYNITSVENNITYYCIDLHLTSVCRYVGLYTNHDKVSIYPISIYLENTHELIFYRIRNCVHQNKFRSHSIFVSATYIMKLYDQTILDTFQNVLVNNANDCNMYILVI